MQPGFDVPCASARLQNPAAALLLSLSAPVKNVLNSSHDSFLFAFDRVLLPFPGRKRRPPKKNPDTMEELQSVFSPSASFSLEPENIHQPAGSASPLVVVFDYKAVPVECPSQAPPAPNKIK